MKKILLIMSMLLMPSLLFADKMEINGVAAATMNNACKITSLTPTSGAITVKWTERYSDGTMVLKYGTTNPPATSRAVAANERSAKTVVISNLQPSTTYYIEIVASKTGENSYGANGSVATLASTAVKNLNVAENSIVTVIQNGHSISIQSNQQLSNTASIQLFNAAGALVNVQNGNVEKDRYQMSFGTDGLSQGKYILKVTANGTSIDRIIIIK